MKPEETPDKILLSASRVGMATRCPYQLKMYQTFGPVPPSIAMVQGSAAHSAYESHYRQIIQGGTGFTKQKAQEWFRATLMHKVTEEEVIYDSMNRDKAVDQGIALVGAYMDGIAPHVKPADVELEFGFDWGWCSRLRGFIDLVEQDGSLRDTKHKGRTPTQNDVDHDWQLSIYCLALRTLGRKDPPEVSLDVVVKKKKPEAVRIVTTRTDRQLEHTKKLINRVVNMTVEDTFTPNTNGWWCSEKFCGWWNLCMFGGAFGLPDAR